jgi:hypothetical protein
MCLSDSTFQQPRVVINDPNRTHAQPSVSFPRSSRISRKHPPLSDNHTRISDTVLAFNHHVTCVTTKERFPFSPFLPFSPLSTYHGESIGNQESRIPILSPIGSVFLLETCFIFYSALVTHYYFSCGGNLLHFSAVRLPFLPSMSKTTTRQLSRVFSPDQRQLSGASRTSRRILCHKNDNPAPSSRLVAVTSAAILHLPPLLMGTVISQYPFKFFVF